MIESLIINKHCLLLSGNHKIWQNPVSKNELILFCNFVLGGWGERTHLCTQDEGIK